MLDFIPIYWRKLAERGAVTFLTVFALTYFPSWVHADGLGAFLDLSVASKAATAGLGAVGAMILGVLTKPIGPDKDSPGVQ